MGDVSIISNKHSVERKASGFDVNPKNIQEAMQFATMVSNSQLAPKDYRGRPEDTLISMMMGNELGLNPLQSIQNIAVINGRPSIWGDALLALVQNHPSFKSIDESFDESTMTASCTVCRKGGKPHTSTFSRADAETAGLWGRNTWKQYPKRMLAMRARGFALRNQFADALLGLITREEAEDLPVDEVVEPSPQEPSYYSQSDFDKNIDKWLSVIESGKKTADEIIVMIESKAPLTEEQKAQIKGGNNAKD